MQHQPRPVPERAYAHARSICADGHGAHYLEMAELELELSRAARDAFHSHRYESCLSALNKLLDTRRYDVRVIHNRAVAQYLLSNLTHTDDFRRTLHSVNVQVTKIPHANMCNISFPC